MEWNIGSTLPCNNKWINLFFIGLSILRDHLYTSHMSAFTAGTSVMYSTLLDLIFSFCPPLCLPLTLVSWDHWPSEWDNHTQSFRPYFRENAPVKTVIWFFPLNHVWSRSSDEMTKLQSELLIEDTGSAGKAWFPHSSSQTQLNSKCLYGLFRDS